MTTIILGLGALTIAMGYKLKNKEKIISNQEREIQELVAELSSKDIFNSQEIDWYVGLLHKEKDYFEKQKENWKQTSSAWILEKEEMIERLERENFNQLHELALMLNASYDVDKVILKKAELHDYLLHNANRRQRREFIEKGQFEL